MDFRKIVRWAVNVLAFAAAVFTLPEFGGLVPAAWLPAIAAVTSIINVALSVLRQFQAGEAAFHK